MHATGIDQETNICGDPVNGGLLSQPLTEASGAQANSEPLNASDLLPADLLDGGEIVILAVKPSLWFVVFMSFRWLVAMVAVVLLADWITQVMPYFNARMIVQGAVAMAAARVGFALLQWVSRLYVLTNRRVMRLMGIFNVNLFECQLNKIQNTYLTLAWYERLVGLGTISFATAGTGGIEASWLNVNNPLELHERVRAAIQRAGNSGDGNGL